MNYEELFGGDGPPEQGSYKNVKPLPTAAPLPIEDCSWESGGQLKSTDELIAQMTHDAYVASILGEPVTKSTPVHQQPAMEFDADWVEQAIRSAHTEQSFAKRTRPSDRKHGKLDGIVAKFKEKLSKYSVADDDEFWRNFTKKCNRLVNEAVQNA